MRHQIEITTGVQRAIQLAFVLRLLVLAPLICSAQSGDKEISFRSKRWTTEEGLPQNRISCLKQTRDGSLWIGTWFGLTRFDGVHFTTFTKANTPELGDDAIKFLVEDASGTLWIGTRDGVVSYRDKIFQPLTNDVDENRGSHKRHDAVYMAVSSPSDFWVRSLRSVQKFHGGKFFSAIDLPRARAVFPMVSEKSGGLNILNAPMWLELSAQGELTTNRLVGLPDCEWLSAFPFDEKSFWVGTSAGLFYLEKQMDGNVQATFDADLGNSPIQFVYQDRSGNVWVNAGSGKLKRCLNPKISTSNVNAAAWNNVNLGEEFFGSSVFCMEEDSEGSFWIGTDRGLFQVQLPRVRVFSSRDGLPHDNVRSVCEASDGTIWCYTDKGLGRIRNGRVVNFELGESWSHNRAMCPGNNGGIWVANRERGICEIQNDKFAEAISGQQISGATDVLYEDKSGRLWSGSSRDLAVLENGKIISGAELTGQPIAGVYSIFETRDRTLWFASRQNGFVQWRDGKKTIFTERDGLTSKQIWAIHEDATGALWLGGDNGLVRYQNGKFFTFHKQQGLPEETINCILEDDFGFLWLSGLQGIYRVSLAELDAVANGRAEMFRSITFGTTDGMESAETNGETQPAGCKARDGHLWFPTIRGLVVINPANIGANISQTPVLIEKVKADGELIFGEAFDKTGKINNLIARSRDGAAIKIPPGQSDVIEFQYTANSFANPNRTRFRYRLGGTDSQWREETMERTVRYINLRPGDYRFEVIAADHHGIWSATPATFAFSIAPHFWQRWQFYFAGILLVSGVAISVHRYRLRWQRRVLKLDEQRALAFQRSRIARDLHDDLGAALTGLALEMDVVGRENPRASSITERLGETAQRTRELAERMREVVWATNPRCDTASSLTDFLEEQISRFLRNADILVHLEFPEDIPVAAIDGEARHQIMLSVREALANIVRHARATCVEARLEFTDKTVLLSLKDNGCGFNLDTAAGNGLGNMRSRMEQIGGTFQCISRPGGGTEIRFRVPLSNHVTAPRTSALENK